MCQSLTHLLKIPAFMALGFDYLEHGPILILLVAMVIIGTVVGKRALQRLDERSFERLFVVVLSLLAINLIAGHFW